MHAALHPELHPTPATTAGSGSETPGEFGSSWGREAGSKSGLPPDPWTATPDGEGTGGPLPLQLSMSDEELCAQTPQHHPRPVALTDCALQTSSTCTGTWWCPGCSARSSSPS